MSSQVQLRHCVFHLDCGSSLEKNILLLNVVLLSAHSISSPV